MEWIVRGLSTNSTKRFLEMFHFSSGLYQSKSCTLLRFVVLILSCPIAYWSIYNGNIYYLLDPNICVHFERRYARR